MSWALAAGEGLEDVEGGGGGQWVGEVRAVADRGVVEVERDVWAQLAAFVDQVGGQAGVVGVGDGEGGCDRRCVGLELAQRREEALQVWGETKSGHAGMIVGGAWSGSALRFSIP